MHFGIDLGGTKIEGVVLNEQGSPLSRIRVWTEANKGYEHILSKVHALTSQLESEVGEKAKVVGIGHPGVLDPKTKQLKNSNTTCLNGKPLLEDVQTRLQKEVRLANDANCFALAEATLGAGKGARSVFGVIMGTGVGGGIVIDGKVLAGHQGIAGEWGHNILIEDGPPCYCGKRGCVETIISGPALERFYQESSGESIPLAQIAERARSGSDKKAKAAIDRLTMCFGKAISVVVNIIDPEVVVLGGGLSNVEELYTDGRDSLTRHVFNNRLETAIRKNQLGDSAGVFGAAALCGDFIGSGDK